VIISHKHKFIFIHCRKVAGSSIKVELAKYLGEKDIVVGSLHEIAKSDISIPKRSLMAVFTFPGILSLPINILKGDGLYESINKSSKYKYYKKLSKNPPHPPARLIKEAYPKEWREYYKFAFCRNPYERLVSDYLWVQRINKVNISFRTYLIALREKNYKSGLIHKEGVSNLDMITIDGDLVVDFLGRYECIEKDFKKICDDIGLNCKKLETVQKKGGSKGEYGNYYNKEEFELAKEIVGKEAQFLSYEFPYRI